jgi:tetratricopeptide (TPR) repeat protein/transcriptional regulator with XRE-family HTH domain
MRPALWQRPDAFVRSRYRWAGESPLNEGGAQSSTFGQILRRYRAEAGLTQQALATRAGLSVDAIGMLERGVRATPRVGTVVRMAEALRLGPADRESLIAAARRPPAPNGSSPAPAVPLELPRAPADFTGRAAELAELQERLGAGAPNPALIAISGMGGVGKSALAVQAAHRLADAGAFPDGQIYVNLHGATPGLSPLTAEDALCRMLRSLGAGPAAIPLQLDEAAARFRSLTARRRLLVVLDNARGADQVRPLLPGGPSCAVLVTSRQVLATLEGAWQLHLNVLPERQALELLGRIAGAERIALEPDAAASVVRRCGGLPLAIRIAGAHLAARLDLSLPVLAARIASTADRLRVLDAGDMAVGACFDVSLRALRESPDEVDRAAAATFGLLSLPDGPSFSVAAAARLADQPEPAAQALAERLVDAQLLDAVRPGRYQFHDLVRLFAREHALGQHPESERRAALDRLVEFYTETAANTLVHLFPAHSAARNGAGQRFADPATALGWLEAERPNLMAGVAHAAAGPGTRTLEEPAARLARALFGLFEVGSYWQDCVRANTIARDAAGRAGDHAATATASHHLGLGYGALGRYREAIECLSESLDGCRECGFRREEAAALGTLGLVYERLGRSAEAIDCMQSAATISAELDNPWGRAYSLLNLGYVLGRAGRSAEAIGCLNESLATYAELGDRRHEASCLIELGGIYVRSGRCADAIEALQRGHAVAREFGNRWLEADSLSGLGAACGRLGRHREAVQSLQKSLAIWRDVGERGQQVAVLRDLGDALLADGKSGQAIAAWEEGLAIGHTLGIPEAAEIRARLAELHGNGPDRRS